MSYALLWIETLLACLLFLAMFIAFGMRRKMRMARILCALVALLPLIPLVLLLLLTGALRFASGMQSSGFGWAIALLCCYLVGAVAIRVVARRRDSSGIPQVLSWPLLRITSAWLVVVSLIAMTLWNLDLRAQIEIQALRAEAGAIALGAALPQIPDSANAALVYEQADEQFAAAMTPADKDIDSSDLAPGSPGIQEYLQRQHKTLELIRRAADMPECRVQFNFAKPDIQQLINQWPRYRHSVRLLAVAAKAEAATGDPDLAVADLRRMFSLTGHVGSAPALIGGLTTISCDALACETAGKVLPSVTTKEQVDRLGLLDLSALPRTFARCLRTEEALGLALFCDMASGSGVYNPSIPTSAGHIMWLAYLRDHITAYQDVLRRAQKMAELPYYQTVSERLQIDEQRGRNVLLQTLTPSLVLSLRVLAMAQAQRSAVVVACAATRYRLDHGQYPATSASLMPAYLEAMPLDPFDGRPLRLKKGDDGSLVIYSVGTDGKDDGGEVEHMDKTHRPIDVGLILKMPPAR